jgi:hypothetical protein
MSTTSKSKALIERFVEELTTAQNGSDAELDQEAAEHISFIAACQEDEDKNGATFFSDFISKPQESTNPQQLVEEKLQASSQNTEYCGKDDSSSRTSGKNRWQSRRSTKRGGRIAREIHPKEESKSSSNEEDSKLSRPSGRNLDLMYKVQVNRHLSSAEEFDRKCSRIRAHLTKLNINMKDAPTRPETTDHVPKKRFQPPLKLPSLSIFKTGKGFKT